MKIANRFIKSLQKIPGRKIFIRTLMILPVLFLMLINEGRTADYSPDIENPFLDVFYYYFNNDPGNAKKLLKKQFDNPARGTQAYINYGLIMEYEKNYKEAESFYRKALGLNDRTSIVYLYNLYKQYDKSKGMCLLDAVQKNVSGCWADYEKAVYYIEHDDRRMALEGLSAAVKNGFNSPSMLASDPAFADLRNDRQFLYLAHKAKMNYSEKDSLNHALKEAVFRYRLDKPYGMNMELDAAAYLEKTGKDNEAMNVLETMLEKQTGFRDRSIALFWMARIKGRLHEKSAAEKYLKEFINHIHGKEIDETGYKKLIAPIYKDIIMNDRYLKDIH